MLPPWNVEDFLSTCAVSSQSAFDAFQDLSRELDDAKTRRNARRKLTSIMRAPKLQASNDAFTGLYFSVEKLVTSTVENEEREFSLIQFPSIFLPELWSFTFFEGLLRLPQSEFQGRTVVELGCGSGWISIILAQRCLPARIIGLDINPRAIVCSRLNLYLNGLDDDGNPKLDGEGRSLIERVEFHESDLLAYCRNENIVPDRIIGCIPQVLSPDAGELLEDLRNQSDDVSLHALSNYYVPQGAIEDQFGLGLIARAVEESIAAIKPSGKIVLNLGGRPGRDVLERLFARRGMKTKLVWSTKVEQAGDTDISALVAIESQSAHRFEFFMGLASDEPISAGTAQGFAQAGGQIAHNLLVMEASLRQPQATKRILKSLATFSSPAPRNRLDLSFADDALLEEKSSFLAGFLEKLEGPPEKLFGYGDTAGQAPFRRRMAEYLRSYWRIPLSAGCIQVFPTRADVTLNLCRIYRPKTVLIDGELLREIKTLTGTPGSEMSGTWDGFARVELFEAPRKAENVARLVESLSPQFVALCLAPGEHDSMDALERLFAATAAAEARLLLDISALLELSSEPSGNAVARYLSERRLPSHVLLVAGLINNRVYRDLQVAVVLSECAEILDALTRAAELTYSRVPSFSQLYYDQILADLLNFQLRHRDKLQTVRVPLKVLPKEQLNLAVQPDASRAPALIPFSPEFESVRQHPAVASHGWAVTRETVRLDYGENLFSPPPELVAGIAVALVKKHPEPARGRLELQIAKRLYERFEIEWVGLNCAFGSGVAPLFAGLAERCAHEDGVLLFPSGCYGHFEAAARFLGADTKRVKTLREHSFKMNAAALSEVRQGRKNAKPLWLYFNLPAVNPTGALYTATEMEEVFNWAQSNKVTIVLDTIFSGLEYDASKIQLPIGLLRTQFPGIRWVLLGGISKEWASGGLRFGYGVSPDTNLITALEQGSCGKPHPLLINALAFAAENPVEPVNYNAILSSRASILCEVLRRCGWDALAPEGGLFLVATPTAYIGKVFSFLRGEDLVPEALNASNITEAMLQSADVLVNNDVWTGIPGYCRFVLSVTESDFERGLVALKKFAAEILGKP